MFIENKYRNLYFKIINNAVNRRLDSNIYVERHHIIPRSLGGDNSKSNIVKLTAREHFICHLLLIKFVESNYHQIKMKYALGKFIQCNKQQKRILTARQYDIVRKAISEARTGYKHTKEAREQMSLTRKGRKSPNKGRRGYFKHSEEAKQRIGDYNRGKTFNERFGIERAKEIIEQMKQTKRGKPSGMLGKKHSKETIIKLSRPKKGSQHIRTICPHCNEENKTPRHIKYCEKITYK